MAGKRRPQRGEGLTATPHNGIPVARGNSRRGRNSHAETDGSITPHVQDCEASEAQSAGATRPRRRLETNRGVTCCVPLEYRLLNGDAASHVEPFQLPEQGGRAPKPLSVLFSRCRFERASGPPTCSLSRQTHTTLTRLNRRNWIAIERPGILSCDTGEYASSASPGQSFDVLSFGSFSSLRLVGGRPPNYRGDRDAAIESKGESGSGGNSARRTNARIDRFLGGRNPEESEGDRPLALHRHSDGSGAWRLVQVLPGAELCCDDYPQNGEDFARSRGLTGAAR